jgi:hypothetical protein
VTTDTSANPQPHRHGRQAHARAGHGGPPPLQVRGWLLWTAGFVSFPIAGIAAQATVGRINDAVAALVGGLVAGAVIGAGQWLVARRLLGDPLAWIAATAAAMGAGLLAGAWVVGYGTSVGELAVMGAITGLPVGAVQAFLLRDRLAPCWVWAVAVPLLWAPGWTVTAAAGVGVDSQYAVFGAFGAITFMALSGVVLDRLRAATPAAPIPHRTARPLRPPSCDELRRVTGLLLAASAAASAAAAKTPWSPTPAPGPERHSELTQHERRITARDLRDRGHRPGHPGRPASPRRDRPDGQPLRHRPGPRRHRGPLEVHATPLDQALADTLAPTAPAQHRNPTGLRKGAVEDQPARPWGGSTSRSRGEHQHGCTERGDVRSCDRCHGRPRA